jgi:hypothetical protein
MQCPKKSKNKKQKDTDHAARGVLKISCSPKVDAKLAPDATAHT